MSVVGTHGFQFPKNQRLVCSAEFQSVIRFGCRSKDPLFIVYAHDNGGQAGRLGATVSRRVAGRAVERNRIKRAIKESFRHQQTIFVGLDVVTVARRETRGTETKQLFASLREHWRRVTQQCRSAS